MGSLCCSSIFTNSGRSLGSPVSFLPTFASTHASCLRKNYTSNAVVSFCSNNKITACESCKRHVFTHTAATTIPSLSRISLLASMSLTNIPLRVEHLVPKEGMFWNTSVEHWIFHLCLLQISSILVLFIMPVCPKPPPTATLEQIRIVKEVTDPSVLSKRAPIKGKTVR